MKMRTALTCFPVVATAMTAVVWVTAGPPPPLAAAAIGFMVGVSVTGRYMLARR